MTRGRKPKPTTLRILQGKAGHRPINSAEPQPKAGKPKMPVNVSRVPIAKSCWTWLVAELDAMKTLTTADAKIVEFFAVTYGHWRTATKAIEAGGLTYETEVDGDHRIIVRPEVAVAAQTVARLESLGAELGLSPSSRTRIKINKPEEAGNPVIEAMRAAAAARASG